MRIVEPVDIWQYRRGNQPIHAMGHTEKPTLQPAIAMDPSCLIHGFSQQF